MTVAIVDVNERAFKANGLFNVSDDTQTRILPLSEYIEIAKKTIGKFASPSVANEMLKSEDAISFVTDHLIKGTLRWKADGGRTLYAYLNQCAIWAIQRWILNIKVARKNAAVSLDTPIDDEGGTMYSFVENGNGNVSINTGPSFDEIIDKECLNETQKTCLRMKFVEGMTYRAIGTALNKTGSRIEQIVSTAIAKLKKEYEHA